MPLVAAGLAAVALPALASGKAASAPAVTYHGRAVRITTAGVVDFARLARLEASRPQTNGPLKPYPLPEPQEKP
ncbi:MAG TPA: hypothetical protein VE753_00790, partial [Gaiellaceae bacterium]|nr:hypothetical protein [Gaiellaceae bacterium]